MAHTPILKIKKYIPKKHIFQTLEQSQKFIRKNTAPDYIVIDNILFTMEEFDESGELITYYNKRTDNHLELTTLNRYKYGFKDAVLAIYDNWGIYRNDITYLD